jgi:signal transduction histidine kinase
MRIECDVEVRGALPALDTEQATAVFRVFQEILSNVARHARATRVQIRMAEQAGRFVLEVSDNGRGITRAEQFSPIALGLLGMRERIENLGGEVAIQGAPDAGTMVTVSLTIKPA